eukprot:TRINITY_DN7021_c0_g1_i3.p1 TRINITY_DN7021_c0_g1~~TRINITY_DN7021_c0_g1_i3.p1  ORF type:complete len:377 (-),score=91.50 TRINITY_DN7021_c0_g1_i3:74-1069(-)
MSEIEEKNQASVRIGTHDGTFHCDEALACYMLRLTQQFRGAEVVRTRDPALLESLPVICDVGGVYDPARHRYDHHQRGFDQTFDEKHHTKLSSAGLIYKHFGREIIASELGAEAAPQLVELVYQRIYDSFIEAIDGVDNGVSQYGPEAGAPRYRVNTSLPSRVSYLNPEWNEHNVDMMSRFHQAMEMTGSEFLQAVRRLTHAWLPARQFVKEAFDKRFEVDPSGSIVFFPTFVPWKEHLLEIERECHAENSIKFVLYEDSSHTWRVQTVPEKSDSFISRVPLPEPWRGYRDEQLSQLSGIPDCIFVHASGFIGGNKTYDGVLAMARFALQQ